MFGFLKKKNKNDDMESAINKMNASSNPKFHRTRREEELSFDFNQNNLTIIQEIEDDIYEYRRIYLALKKEEASMEEIIKYCKREVDAYYRLRDFCYSYGEGGKIYFQNMWEYCHNSNNECFPFIENTLKIIEEYDEKQSYVS